MWTNQEEGSSFPFSSFFLCSFNRFILFILFLVSFCISSRLPSRFTTLLPAASLSVGVTTAPRRARQLSRTEPTFFCGTVAGTHGSQNVTGFSSVPADVRPRRRRRRRGGEEWRGERVGQGRFRDILAIREIGEIDSTQGTTGLVNPALRVSSWDCSWGNGVSSVE